VPDDSLVLIHGAMHGAWCWRKVRSPLRDRGFDVHAITLTGLGDRAHLLRPETSLNTHIEDVAALIEMEELTGVTIVGHSYGCMVGAGVVARLPGRVRRMIYFDGPVPVDGESSITVHPLGQSFVNRRTVTNGVAVLPPTDGSTLGLADDDLAWVRRHLTPQPYGAVSTPLRLPPGWNDGVEQVYIRCLRGPGDAPAPYLSRVDPAAGWRYYEIRAGHDAMISAPDQLTALITAVCAGEEAVKV
jgi:pimeloyl-ACP methyl ester carboxylesterase